MYSKLLLLLGPTGVGKSTIMEKLPELDSRFVYISPYTTRALRKDETNKISISLGEFNALDKNGKFLAVNQLYGVFYGTPMKPIMDAFEAQKFPMLDWPVQKIEKMRIKFPEKTFSVYIEPPSLESLMARLGFDNNRGDERKVAAENEYRALLRNEFIGRFDYRVVSNDNNVKETAKLIHKVYLTSLNQKEFNAETVNTSMGQKLIESEDDMKARMKRDSFRSARGGKAVMLDVHCSKCDTKVLWYQKDGTGNLLRCYINRIFAPPELAKLQQDPNLTEPKNMPNLTCPSCDTVLGTPMRYSDGRLAFRLRPGFVTKTRSKDTGN
ncbi:MAG TPA: hypothetical protein VND15_04255 [Candidatus Acidoferrales bacterium]|nr:hypothetical protein [Candidatus Acidoferrales bacterium]